MILPNNKFVIDAESVEGKVETGTVGKGREGDGLGLVAEGKEGESVGFTLGTEGRFVFMLLDR